MKIGIDARMIKATGIGRYIENLILELAKINGEHAQRPIPRSLGEEGSQKVEVGNQYVLFLRKEEFDNFDLPAALTKEGKILEPKAQSSSNFSKVLADFHWYSKAEQLGFPKVIASQNLDLMHFPHFNVPLLYNGKFVITIHDLTLHTHKTIRASTKSALTYQIKHLLYKYIIRRAAKKAAKIFVPSNFTKSDVLKLLKVPEGKVVVTLEGGPSEELLKLEPDFGVLEKFNIKKPFIFYVGNCYPHKNIESLVKALEFLPKNITLVLAGKSDEFHQKLKLKIKELGLQDRVVMTDFVSDGELAALYKSASVYAFPSFNEGFGLPPLEAMSFGLPVATSSASCLPEILGDSALLFNPRDPKDIAEKIGNIMENEKLRGELVEKGLRQVKKYSWAKMAKETLNAYSEVLGND